ncbi:MAG: hypothetical protein IPM91_04045 [Bacteroidetes bacterium]|nr:hypothetical protein [Bacteroidota bacterium]
MEQGEESYWNYTVYVYFNSATASFFPTGHPAKARTAINGNTGKRNREEAEGPVSTTK